MMKKWALGIVCGLSLIAIVSFVFYAKVIQGRKNNAVINAPQKKAPVKINKKKKVRLKIEQPQVIISNPQISGGDNCKIKIESEAKKEVEVSDNRLEKLNNYRGRIIYIRQYPDMYVNPISISLEAVGDGFAPEDLGLTIKELASMRELLSEEE